MYHRQTYQVLYAVDIWENRLMNNSGPSIEPLGMPHDVYCSVDKTAFT